MEASPSPALTRRSALRAGIAVAGSAALAAALDACSSPKKTPIPTKTPEDHKLAPGWTARNGWPATNHQGSYLADNIVVNNGVVTMRATVDPHRAASSEVTSSKQHFGSGIDGPTFLYGTVKVTARLPWANDPSKQIAKPVLMLWPEKDTDWPKKTEVDFLEASTDTVQNGHIDVNVNYGKTKTNDSNSFALDDAWHEYTVTWKKDLLEVLVDGNSILRTEKIDEIPVGNHRLIFQVDFDSIPEDAPENELQSLDVIEIKDVSVKTLARSFDPTFG